MDFSCSSATIRYLCLLITVGNFVSHLEHVYIPTLLSVIPRSPFEGSTMTEKVLVGRASLFPHFGQFGKRLCGARERVKALLLANRFELRNGRPERDPCEGRHVGVLSDLVEETNRVGRPYSHALLLVLEHQDGIFDDLPDVARRYVRVNNLVKAYRGLRELRVVLLLLFQFSTHVKELCL